MSKRIKTLLVALIAMICVFASSVTPAFAYVDPTWDGGETQVTDEPVEEQVVTEGPANTVAEQPFSTPGNGDLGDVITSGMKDFYTIRTKNNNTFYLVIDHAGSQDNVYMLSLIDENDLADFLTETVKEPETQEQQPVVIVPDTTKDQETEQQPAVTPDTQKNETGNTSLMTLVILAVIGVGGAVYYFKVYKPKKEADDYESEGMETGDGLPTENEDEENEA